LKNSREKNTVLAVPPVPVSTALGIKGLKVVQVVFLGGTGFYPNFSTFCPNNGIGGIAMV